LIFAETANLIELTFLLHKIKVQIRKILSK